MKLNIVPARTGLLWVKLGISTFMKQPLALTTLCFVYMAFVMLLLAIPLIGPFILLLLIPAGTLGLMAATEIASSGRMPTPLILVSAFRAGKQRARAMLLLGLMYLGAAMVVALLMYFILPSVPENAKPTDPAFQAQVAKAYIFAAIIQLPVAIAFWHAPALVHWHDVAPVKSLFFSAVAWVRNFSAFLVYLFIWGAIFIGAVLLAELVSLLLPGDIGKVIAAPLVMIVSAMFFTSLYFTFRDSFVATPPPVSSLPDQPPGDSDDPAHT